MTRQPNTAHILVVDDEKDIRELVKDILEDEGYQVTTAANGVQAREAWRQGAPDVVFLDVWMPDVDGISLLREMKEEGLLAHTNVVMISGHGTIETAVEATRLGAWDFLEKPLSLHKLLMAAERALKHLQLHRVQHQLKAQHEWESELIGKSREMRQLREDVERLARYTMPVLISGERGSGRHQFARAVHQHSDRRDRPILSLDAQQLNSQPERWLGYEKGRKAQIGEIEQAQGGSIIINEIHRLDLSLQQWLLDVLQNGEFTRPHGKTPVHLDIRVFALTDCSLDEAVKLNRFLPQLAYRLQLTQIHIPPLRHHLDDLPELIDFFVEHQSSLNGLPWRPFDISAQNLMRQHNWPGNLIELQNMIQRLLMQGEAEQPVTAEEVEALIKTPTTPAPSVSSNTGSTIDLSIPLKEAREAFEAEYLRQMLRETDGCVSETARRSGLERTHLYRKLKQLGIDPKHP